MFQIPKLSFSGSMFILKQFPLFSPYAYVQNIIETVDDAEHRETINIRPCAGAMKRQIRWANFTMPTHKQTGVIRKQLYTGYTQKNGAVSKLTRNLFLTLHGHNVHRQQRQLSKFLMRYQQFASHAYCGAAGPVSKMESQQEKAFCVLRFEVSRSVITVQREFCARFRKDAPFRNIITRWCRQFVYCENLKSGG